MVVGIIIAVIAFSAAVKVLGTTNDTAAPTEPPRPTEGMTEMTIHRRCLGTEDREVLLKIAMAEAEGEPLEGKALVMRVILNRVGDDGFPDTVKDVVFQTSPSVQFTPIEQGGRYWTTDPNDECYEALEMIENGWDKSDGALYFESYHGESWHSRNLEFLYQVGGHKFYR